MEGPVHGGLETADDAPVCHKGVGFEKQGAEVAVFHNAPVEIVAVAGVLQGVVAELLHAGAAYAPHAEAAVGLEKLRQIEIPGQPGLPQEHIILPGVDAVAPAVIVQGLDLHAEAGLAEDLGHPMGHFHPGRVRGAHQQRPHVALRDPGPRQGQGKGLPIIAVALGQLLVVEGAAGRAGQTGRLAEALVDLGDQALPVDDVGHGGAELPLIEDAVGQVEADILHNGGGTVPELIVAAVAHGVGGVEVGADQGGVPELKAVPDGGGVRSRGEENGVVLHGGPVVLPPIPVPPQAEAAAFLGEGVGAGAQGPLLPLRPRLDDGHVQQQGQVLIGLVEPDLQGMLVPGREGLHLGEAAAVVVGIPGGLQGSDGVPGAQRRAVGKTDPLAEGDHAGPPVLGDGEALAEHRLGLEAVVQHEQGLVNQGEHGPVGDAGAGIGIEAVFGHVGQPEALGLLAAGVQIVGVGLRLHGLRGVLPRPRRRQRAAGKQANT